MKTAEIRSLLTDKKKEIKLSQEMIDIFNLWCKAKQKHGIENSNPLEIFYAGYVLSNPVVREQYKQAEIDGLLG